MTPPLPHHRRVVPAEERWAAIQMAQLRTQRIQSAATEAARQGDLERLKALGDEQEVILEGLRQIREDQIMEDLERRRPQPKRRWWRR